MVFAIVGGDGKPTGYDIDNSLRFNDGGTYLTRAQANGNQDKWTWSGWVKRSTLGAAQCLFATTDGSATSFDAKFDGSDNLDVYNYLGGGFGARLITNRVFRDVSAWYHIVIVYDSGNGTEAHRLRIYVNGTEESSFSTTNYPSQNEDSDLNVSGSNIEIGRQANGSQFFDGYMAEMFLLDGQALAPSSFGETNDNGVWIPKDAKDDLTFGTNGFYLQFQQTGTSQNSSGMGADTSGNDNHLAVSNLTATDVTTDTPTNNFCTLNPLDNNEVPNTGNHVYAEGNTKFTATAGDNDTSVQGTNCTMAVANGKWYWEAEIDVVGPNYPGAGILAAESHKLSSIRNGYAWNAAVSAYGYEYLADGQIGNNDNATSSGWSAWNTAGKILMFALDMDNNKLYYGQNGTWDNSGDPTSGSTGTGAQSVNSSFSYFPHFHLRAYDGSASPGVFLVNFGNPPFSISSSNADANGYGNFEYAVPSGYYSLCTKNLAEYG